MAEEFHESDIIFSDYHHRRRHCRCLLHPSFDYAQFITHRNTKINNDDDNDNNNNNNDKNFAASLPVKIPETVFRYTSDMDDVGWDSDDDMVPPHVIVRRRVAGKMAFSVCTGNGRTLKGRDLSQVRNSILRMTGFLET